MVKVSSESWFFSHRIPSHRQDLQVKAAMERLQQNWQVYANKTDQFVTVDQLNQCC